MEKRKEDNPLDQKIDKPLKKSKTATKQTEKLILQSSLSGFFGIQPQSSLKQKGQAKYDDFPSSKISIYHWNINGINAIMNKGAFEEFMNKEDPLIICLNEIKIDQERLEKSGFQNRIPKDYEQYWNCCKVSKGYSGTAIFTKVKPISVKYDIDVPKHDGEGRVITMEFKEFVLVATYIPNSGRDLKRLVYRTQEWDKDFHDYLERLRLSKDKPLILSGDLNVALDPIDVYDPKGKDKIACYTPQERESFRKFLERGFIDTFRHMYPEKQEFSYYSPLINARQSGKGWRIDYFVVYKSDIDMVVDSLIHFKYAGSDHVPIQLIVDIDIARKISKDTRDGKYEEIKNGEEDQVIKVDVEMKEEIITGNNDGGSMEAMEKLKLNYSFTKSKSARSKSKQ